WRTRRTDQIADVHVAQTHASVDRRFDVAKIEIHLSCLGRRLRFLRVCHCQVVILRGVDTLRPQISLSLQRYLVQRRLRFRLIDSRLIWARIDGEKRIAFLYIGTILEIACHDLSGHLRLDLDGLVGGTGSDFIQIKRNVFAGHLRNQNGTDWRWRRCFLPACNDANSRKNNQDRDNTTYEINAFTAITSFKVCDTLAHRDIYVSQRAHFCLPLFPFVPGARSIRSRTLFSTRMQTSMSRFGISLINSRRSFSAVALIRLITRWVRGCKCTVLH